VSSGDDDSRKTGRAPVRTCQRGAVVGCLGEGSETDLSRGRCSVRMRAASQWHICRQYSSSAAPPGSSAVLNAWCDVCEDNSAASNCDARRSDTSQNFWRKRGNHDSTPPHGATSTLHSHQVSHSLLPSPR
jgi:hypothetical protein